MEIIEAANSIEKALNRKADENRIPLGGGFELLPFCNMNCNMCYVRNNEPSQWKNVLSAEQWIEIAQKAQNAGTLYILLTGGEPLLHPQFREIYQSLANMGFILTVNTNGTLIDESWADFFAETPCRRLNVTLYGASNETYARLCHNPKGFDQTVTALKLLKERGCRVRINVTLVKENRDDLEQIVALSRSLDIPFVPTAYMFPPTRKEQRHFYESRMSPAEAAESRLAATFYRNPDIDPAEQARALIDTITGPRGVMVRNYGFSCKATLSEYWVNWKGELSPCGMIPTPRENLLKTDFLKAWQRIGNICDSEKTCVTCRTCAKKMFCQSCAAACLSETGTFSGRPEYLCQVTDEMLEKVLDYIEDPAERMRYRKKLKNNYTTANSPIITIVLIVENCKETLEECIDSILMQFMQSFELILIDNGSTDGSGKICDSYADLDNRVRVVHQSKKDPDIVKASAKKMAKTMHILYLDKAKKVDYNWCSGYVSKFDIKVSIIIPVYNVEKYLARCINSIINQTLSNFELILVDDGSTDDSGKICDAYAEQDFRIRVIHQKNRGVSAARNAGIDAAQAPYILFADSDDYAESTWASSLYEKILERPNALIMTNVWAGNEEHHRKVTIHEDFPDYEHIPLDKSELFVVFAYVWNKIYDKKILSEIRFNENCCYGEDYRFNQEYAQKCTEAVLIPEPLFVHLDHEGGLARQGLAKEGKSVEDFDFSNDGYLVKISTTSKF